MSPMAWLADARIDRAREILETTTEPVENIGRLTGLGAPVSVRAAFHRRIGISPKEYRAAWHGSSISAAGRVPSRRWTGLIRTHRGTAGAQIPTQVRPA